ncbi:phage tail protein [Salmonella enterica subsp. diarizonae serovar 16:z10:e,n,x,z15]|uniref:phage tail-collar fiber domain-containing protein n=1 Tax=Salmonella enterica TaxID=28901 RepID=UPI001F0FE717|nr:phage tail protein [Salmonella enterica subsp. diarizonae serovar 16:z10:e,n,x,z15]MCH5505390.1 phage tail protein [Salmonella enterica subsp. diarizonae serovar 16:z10:e,n,x,z15]
MPQTTTTLAFERYKAQEAAGGRRVVLDEFVFANIPGLDVAQLPSSSEGLPDEQYIVHRQSVDRGGMVNNNTVIYTVTLPTTAGNFTFNWMALINHESGTPAVITYLYPQQKIKNADGVQGNVLTYSELMRYRGASALTGITTPASTWQIDFTARLHGMDEDTRKVALDIYGQALFFGDAFKVTATDTPGRAELAPGAAYLRGLRTELDGVATLTFETGKEQTICLDSALTGSLTGENRTTFTLISHETADYTDSLGFRHYVEPIARIAADGTITDLRNTGRSVSEQLSGDFLTRAGNLSEIADNGDKAKADARKHLGLGNSATLDVGTTENTVAAGDDSRIIAAKKAIDDTQTGLPEQPVMWISSADELSYLPAGARRFAHNKPGVSVLPVDNYCYIEVTAKRDTANGGCIRVVDYSNPGSVWNGTRNAVPDEAAFTWVRQYTETYKPPQMAMPDALLRGNNLSDLTNPSLAIDRLGLRDTVNRAAHVYASDGDLNGSIWGGYLSSYLNRFASSSWVSQNFASKSTASKSTNGWFKDASTGLIIQWGTAPGGTGTSTVSLPVPFPYAGLWALGWVAGALWYGNDDWSNSAGLINKSQISVTVDHGSATAWLAIGY